LETEASPLALLVTIRAVFMSNPLAKVLRGPM
jgi:hypothetical protein